MKPRCTHRNTRYSSYGEVDREPYDRVPRRCDLPPGNNGSLGPPEVRVTQGPTHDLPPFISHRPHWPCHEVVRCPSQKPRHQDRSSDAATALGVLRLADLSWHGRECGRDERPSAF